MNKNQVQTNVNPFVANELETIRIIKDYKNLHNDGNISEKEFETSKDKILANRSYDTMVLNNAQPEKNVIYIIYGVLCGLIGIVMLVVSFLEGTTGAESAFALGAACLVASVMFFIGNNKYIGLASLASGLLMIVLTFIKLINIGFLLKVFTFRSVSMALLFAFMGFGFINKGKKQVKVYTIASAVSLILMFVLFLIGDSSNVAGSILISVIFVPIIYTFFVDGKTPKKASRQMQVKISVTQADFLIHEYSALLDSGAISQQDFENKKASLLSKTE